MAKKTETLFVEKITPLLNNIADSCWFNIQQRSIKGTPDIIGCVNGTFVALEVKKDKKEIDKRDNRTRLQAYNINKIRVRYGYARFCYPENWDDIYRDLLKISMGRLNLGL